MVYNFAAAERGVRRTGLFNIVHRYRTIFGNIARIIYMAANTISHRDRRSIKQNASVTFKSFGSEPMAANALVVRKTHLPTSQKTLRAAQYVRMSTDYQRYSIENQAVVIAAYA
jgi:hypothetical protein